MLTSLKEVNEYHCVNWLSLVLILHAKGIVTDDELIEARIKATAIVDQAIAEKQEAELDKWPEPLRQFFQ